MRRIGFISVMGGVPWGGSEELWSQTATRLASEGTVVGVNVLEWSTPVPQVEVLKQVGCHVTTRKRTNLFGRAMERCAKQVGLQLDACKWLDRFKPDLVVVSQGCPLEGTDWIDACHKRSIPFAIIVQAAGDRFEMTDALVDVLSPLFRNARACYFVSAANRRYVERQLAMHLPNAKVVRNPFNVSYDASPAWPSESHGMNLACVARLDVGAKGQDILVEVLSDRKWRERPIRITLFGRGPNRGSLESLCRLEGLESIKFGGHAADVESIWKTHHALILPSRVEGLPLALVEAMLCKRPSIVTDVGGNIEAVEDNLSGFVAAAPTAQLLDQAMERAWSRRGSWRIMGEAAGQRARELFPRDPSRVFAAEVSSLLRASKRTTTLLRPVTAH